MSEATLKRKTLAKYNNNSVGTGFSLNGTLRNQGWVGQDTRGRSLPKTLMKGNVIKGHGGNYGTYPQKGIVASAVTSLNDSSVIKSSSLDTKGMIRTKYRWIWRPQPYSTTKQDDSNSTSSQSEYITGIKLTTTHYIDISYSTVSSLACCENLPKEARPKYTTTPHLAQTRFPGDYTKINISRPDRNNPILGILGGNEVNVVMPQSEYIAYLNSGCKDIIQDYSANCLKIKEHRDTVGTPLISGTRYY